MSVHVYGPTVDEHTRCIHYATELDVIAIRFICCDRYYPCHLCHQETADHPATPWPADARDQPAVLCGICGVELSVTEYMAADACPRCAAPFNPGCALHYPLYFAS